MGDVRDSCAFGCRQDVLRETVIEFVDAPATDLERAPRLNRCWVLLPNPQSLRAYELSKGARHLGKDSRCALWFFRF